MQAILTVIAQATRWNAMPPETQPAERIAFGPFELDTASGELFRNGRRIRLSGQPADLLIMLVRRSGQLVTREELRIALWPEDTFVDFDHGLNNCIRRIRDTLGDSADGSHFVETLPKKGYRFIAETHPVLAQQSLPTATSEMTGTAPGKEDPPASVIGRRRLGPWAISLFAIAAAISLFFLGSRFLRHRSRPPELHSVVLLPLTNLSGDSSQDYLTDGVTEELITELAQATSVPVISRTSAMVYGKGKPRPMPEIARELGVDALVEGTLRRSGDTLRVTVHLIEGATDRSLWSKAYDGNMNNVRDLEIRVADDIAEELHAPRQTQVEANTSRPVPIEAYEEYLKGRFFWNKDRATVVRSSSNEAALRHFQRAITIYPDYDADAHAGIAMTYCVMVAGEMVTPSEGFAMIRQAADKALSLDRQNAGGHLARSFVFDEQDWDWPRARAESELSIASHSADSSVYRWYSIVLL